MIEKMEKRQETRFSRERYSPKNKERSVRDTKKVVIRGGITSWNIVDTRVSRLQLGPCNFVAWNKPQLHDISVLITETASSNLENVHRKEEKFSW